MPLMQTLTGSSNSAIKSHNIRAILLALLHHEYVSRVRLSEITGLSTTTITNLVSALIAQGIVQEGSSEQLNRERGVGRPRTAIYLEPEARYAVGVHIGVSGTRVGITNLRGELKQTNVLTHAPDQPPNAIVDQINTQIKTVVTQSDVEPAHVVGIGVGASGLVDSNAGINLYAPNLGWRDVPLCALITEQTGLPVCIDNNVRAMALGEYMFGTAKDTHVLAFVYGRTGVGAGFVLNGELYRGSGIGAGEIGHMTLLADRITESPCPRSGSLEALVSEPTIIHAAQAIAEQHSHSSLHEFLAVAGDPIDNIFAAARAGDEATLHLLRERATYMGVALANLINIFNPELIVIGGTFAKGADLLLPTVEETMRRCAFANLGDSVVLQTTTFGEQAGMVGAAALALNTFFYQQREVTA